MPRVPVSYTKETILLPVDGEAYIVGGKVRSVKTKSGVTKDATPFGSVGRAAECYDVWRSLGLRGAPASPASFWREYARRHRVVPPINGTINNVLRQGFYPSWIECAAFGSVTGQWHHYDLNSAYLWGGIDRPLPERYRPYRPGDKDAIMLVQGWPNDWELPSPLRKERALITSDCIERYGLDIRGRVIEGVQIVSRSWAVRDQLTDLMCALPPDASKRLSQSYWGVWAAQSEPERLIIRGGRVVKRTALPARFQHLPMAALITRAVQSKVYEAAMPDAISVYVDSVLVPRTLATSGQPGGWHHVSSFPRGVEIRAPGVLHDLATAHRTRMSDWYRHAGYAG